MFLACLAILAAPSVVFTTEIDPQKAKASPDGKTLWYDCKDLVVEGKGWVDTQSFYDRLPAKAEGKVTPSVWGLSHHSAGLCVRFTADAPSLQVRWTLLPRGDLSMPHMPATGVSGVDLYSKDKSGRWYFVANGRPAAVANTARFSPPPGQPCLLYLPLYNGVTSVEIGIPKGSTISVPDAAAIKQRKPIVFYGTSITQGGCASRPGMAFTAIVGRQLDTPVINLGFSGSGKMEPAMAESAGGTRSVGVRPRLPVEHDAGNGVHTHRAVCEDASGQPVRTRPSGLPKIAVSRNVCPNGERDASSVRSTRN